MWEQSKAADVPAGYDGEGILQMGSAVLICYQNHSGFLEAYNAQEQVGTMGDDSAAVDHH